VLDVWCTSIAPCKAGAGLAAPHRCESACVCPLS
jgi:hypothetical protein